MPRTTGAASVMLCLFLTSCGGGEADQADDVVETPQAEASAPVEATAAPEVEASAGDVASAPPSCDDPTGDSTGQLDLTSVTVTKSEQGVQFIYSYDGAPPTSGSLLFATFSGSRQYGYKLVDGQKAAHFIFDFSTSQQSDVDEAAEVDQAEARVTFPASEVAVESLAGATAGINVDGQDVDECKLE